MMAKKISRKEFLKLAVGGLAGVSMVGIPEFMPGQSQRQDPKQDYPGQNQQVLKKKQTEAGHDNKFARYIELGKTGIRVSTIGFGVSRTMEPALVEAVIGAGINFMDTGRSYFRGQNEVMVGKALGPRRKDIIIQSKLRVNLSPGQLQSPQDISRALKEMEQSLQACLKALNTDYLDVLLIHGAEELEVIHHQEIRNFFEQKKARGLIRAHGFSTHQNQVELIKAENKVQFFDVIMAPYNHKGAYVHMNSGRKSSWDQQALEKELQEARERGAGVVAMKTCSGGPYSPSPNINPTYEAALRWILERNLVHTMAVAMASFRQIRENTQAWG